MVMYPYYRLTCTKIWMKIDNLFELTTSVHLCDADDVDYSHKHTRNSAWFWLKNFVFHEGKTLEIDFAVVRDTSPRDNPILMNEKPAKTQATEYVAHNSYGIFIQTYAYTHSHTHTLTHSLIASVRAVCSAFIGDGATIIHTVFPYQNTMLSLCVCGCVREKETQQHQQQQSARDTSLIVSMCECVTSFACLRASSPSSLPYSTITNLLSRSGMLGSFAVPLSVCVFSCLLSYALLISSSPANIFGFVLLFVELK